MFDLPSWFQDFRSHQLTAIAAVVSAFNNGHTHVMLDAPTGSGKTLIAESVRQMLSADATYICVTKTLQDQFLKDYEYARVIKGRSNYPVGYPVLGNSYLNVTAADCLGEECSLCPTGCPYTEARNQAKQSPVAVLNLAYALNEFKGARSSFKGRRLKILDECDVIENVLLSHASISISPKMQKEYRITKPDKKTKPTEWYIWTVNTLKVIEKVWNKLEAKVPRGEDETIQHNREKKRVYELWRQLQRLEAELKQGLVDQITTWVYTGYDQDFIEFKPVMVDKFAKELLWNKGGKWLMMSGSIISPQVMANELGIDRYHVVKVDYAFDPGRRPVIVEPVGSMARKSLDATFEKMADRISSKLDLHSTERVLIHTHTYQLAQRLRDRLNMSFAERVLTYGGSGDRQAVLEQYISQAASVIIAPSLDRGVDLPYDLCRVQVIANVPYPYLGDKMIAAKTYGTPGGQMWYVMQTIRAIVQMTGRGMRHSDDRCVTYVLDEDFVKLYRKYKNWFPQWWMDAVIMS